MSYRPVWICNSFSKANTYFPSHACAGYKE